MKVILAGYNLDAQTIKELSRGKKKLPLTPETISAAYARISRSPKSVPDLRDEARHEVARARRSNRRIIFEMSHHSVAEHAVFNFDIIGISRYAVEELEKFRLCSYTEKSQRYVTLKGDYVIPAELTDPQVVSVYKRMIKSQNDCYQELYQKLKLWNFVKHASMARRQECHRTLENWAKEDARYVLSLATQAQLGTTINARNLELMIRRFASHRLAELRGLGEKLFKPAKAIAPSIILFYQANDYDRKTYQELAEYADKIWGYGDNKERGLVDGGIRGYKDKEVKLVSCTPQGDEKILAALLFRVNRRSYADCLVKVKKMSTERKFEVLKQACRYMELYDTTPREFEFAGLTYELIVSAGCFGQLKRHRLASMVTLDYDPDLGVTVPVSVVEIKAQRRFMEIIDQTESVYGKIEKKYPGIGPYILTNAHRKRVLVTMNLRELYHMSRLRQDPTAQWDIRNITRQMVMLAQRRMPVTGSLLCGKTDYPSVYKGIFGKYPKIKEVPPVQ
ncbi:MAG TPA: FAD-dependent thymidylate synthase [bacterium]